MRLGNQAILRPRVSPPAGVSRTDHQEGLEEDHLGCSALGGAKAQDPGVPWPYMCAHAQEFLGRVTWPPGAFRDPAIDTVAMQHWDLPARVLCQDLYMLPVMLGWRKIQICGWGAVLYCALAWTARAVVPGPWWSQSNNQALSIVRKEWDSCSVNSKTMLENQKSHRILGKMYNFWATASDSCLTL